MNGIIDFIMNVLLMETFDKLCSLQIIKHKNGLIFMSKSDYQILDILPEENY